jgi:hypothetical protein
MKRYLTLPWLVCVVLCLTACAPDSEPAPEADLSIEILGLPESVELGEAFPLTIVRRWSRDYAAGPLPASALSPLAFQATDTVREALPTHWRERTQGSARALDFEGLANWSARFEARALLGTSTKSVHSTPQTLRILPARTPTDGMDAELPRDLHFMAPGVLVLTIITATLFCAFWIMRRWLRIRRQRQALPRQLTPQARLAAIAGRKPLSAAEWDAWHVELAAALRAHWEERLHIAAPRMTTEELAVDLEANARCTTELPPSLEVLRACDAVKFAGAAVREAEAQQHLANARTLVSRGQS